MIAMGIMAVFMFVNGHLFVFPGAGTEGVRRLMRIRVPPPGTKRFDLQLTAEFVGPAPHIFASHFLRPYITIRAPARCR